MRDIMTRYIQPIIDYILARDLKRERRQGVINALLDHAKQENNTQVMVNLLERMK